MPNGDHDKLIDQALAWATEQLRTGGHIPFMVFTIDELEREGAFAADPACFAGGDSGREDLAQRMRKQFRKADIVRYAIAAECWVTRLAPPAGPLREPQIGRNGGREEVVIVHVCDRRSATLHISTIARDDAGRATGRAASLRRTTRKACLPDVSPICLRDAFIDAPARFRGQRRR